MANVKRCVQCGILKQEDEFRQYTYSKLKGTEGRYRTCKTCELINVNYNRAKQWLNEKDYFYKAGNPELFQKMSDTVARTELLYNALDAKGLRSPLVGDLRRHEDPLANVNSLIQFHAIDAPERPVVTAIPSALPKLIPDELQQWLDASEDIWLEADISPEYLQETVYESLKVKYRPQIGVDHSTYLPIYDDTYKDVLNQILRKFDDYEEACIAKEE